MGMNSMLANSFGRCQGIQAGPRFPSTCQEKARQGAFKTPKKMTSLTLNRDTILRNALYPHLTIHHLLGFVPKGFRYQEEEQEELETSESEDDPIDDGPVVFVDDEGTDEGGNGRGDDDCQSIRR
jgi:hypothetical protein